MSIVLNEGLPPRLVHGEIVQTGLLLTTAAGSSLDTSRYLAPKFPVENATKGSDIRS